MSNTNSWAGLLNADIKWNKILESSITPKTYYKVVPTEGYIAWEYNPLRNYRLNLNMYEKDGKYYTKKEFLAILLEDLKNTVYLQVPEDLKDEPNLHFLNKAIIAYNEGVSYDKQLNIFEQSDINKPISDEYLKAIYGDTLIEKIGLYTLRESGELVDFITNELSFNLQHPVEILPQYSYDGSVNLILNDGLNIPRLINSRFTVTGKNTYKVIDRKGDNDTNIYDLGEQFDVDTSLFKNVNKIPKLEYLGTSTGNMKIGNYHFYFKYSDADGNESDWVAESGLVSVFIGGNPSSVNTGIRDENSIKSVKFRLSNIDIGYSYVKVYYTRYSADVNSNLVVSAKRIDKNFLINNSGTCIIYINGDENETEVTLEEINSSFDVILTALTQCSAKNRLFMANIHKIRIEYDMLSKLSLCFCPYKHEEPYPLAVDNGINRNYEISTSSHGYYDSEYIYNKTGYWPGELYRLGIVYILKDGSLSPVFNIRGATNISRFYENNYLYKIDKDLNTPINPEEENPIYPTLDKILSEIEYSEEDFMIVGGIAENENAKGVIQLKSESEIQLDNSLSPFPVYGINIKANNQVIEELKKYCKGFFFVRQKRIPLTMCLGLVIGLDKESRTPTLPTIKGMIEEVENNSPNLEYSITSTKDINDINYISEGFLSRYYYEYEKEKLGSGELAFKIIGAAAILAAATAIIILACPAIAAVAGPLLASSSGAAAATAGAAAAGAAGAAAAAGTAATIGGAIAGAASLAGTISGGVLIAGIIGGGVTGLVDWRVKVNRRDKDVELKPLYGKEAEIPEGWERKEKNESRQLTLNFYNRIIIKDYNSNVDEAIIVPDYQVNQPYYNQFLTGAEFIVKTTYEQPDSNYSFDGFYESHKRHFYINSYRYLNPFVTSNVKLIGVPDGCPIKMIGENKYRARAGCAEEAYKYESVGKSYEDNTDIKENSDIIRGNFGSYVGVTGYNGHAGDLVNIMIPGYLDNKLFEYVQLRAQDTSSFYAISDRIDINELNKSNSILNENITNTDPFDQTYFRGDCYICQYTHRIIRNFNDPSAPYNDKIIDPNSWKENYNPDTPEDYANINLGDVNAIQLGLWLTFQLRSSYNLNVRTIDKSHVDESTMCGNYRSFYPHYGQTADGGLKIPDSDQYNKGFSKSVSEKYYFEVPNVPYIKLEFLNRIVFSDIHINDAYKNGFRVLRTMNHKDYPMTYGSITKLVEYQNQLIVVFEHGIGLITINNSAEHTSQILSDLTVISDTYGSQWKDSILKTPSGIYGVDTVAKKIWRVRNGKLELISDMRVQEFLNLNITLSERELTPILGIRNVKTVYNAFKHDIMFTFYDSLYGVHEKSWNLCYNELLQIFTTFYSWIPSDMINIDNIPFSFNRDTVKAIAKLGISDHGNDFSDGITLTNNVLIVNRTAPDTYDFDISDKTLHKYFINKQGLKEEFEINKQTLSDFIDNSPGFIGFLNLDNRILPDEKTKYNISYELMRDNLGNHKIFEIKSQTLPVTHVNELLNDTSTTEIKVLYLCFKEGFGIKNILSELYYRNRFGNSYPDEDWIKISPFFIKENGKITDVCVYTDLPIFKNKQGKRLMLPEELQLNPDKIVRYLNIKANIQIESTNGYNQTNMIDAGYFESSVAITTNFNLRSLSTDFWKHGLGGIIDITDKIYPTYWYGHQHPFEFECIVVDNPSVHKIFTNLELVANKVKPKSFHYEIVGDVYDFSEDKPTMYFRQEALKALYQYNGYNIEYNPNFLEIEPKQHNRSADFPKYYSRWDTINEIYDSYKRFSAPMGFNYDHLAGAEIVYYPTRNEFRIWNHAEAIDVDSLSSELATSVIKANCRYLEDKWLVSINPIVVTYKNEINKSIENSLYTPDLENGVDKRTGLFAKDQYGIYKYSTWVKSFKNDSLLPPINISGTKMKEKLEKLGNDIEFPLKENGKDNSLHELYNLDEWNKGSWRPIDPIKNKDRKETDVRGKFIKIRIRYSGEELAVIDFLNTIYQISFA